MEQVDLETLEKKDIKSNRPFFLRALWLPLVFLLSISNMVQAQLISRDINRYPVGTVFPSSFPGTIVLPAARVGIVTNYTIPLRVQTYSLINATKTAGSCDTIFISGVITYTDSIVHVDVDKKCPGSTGNFINFRFRVEQGSTSDIQNFRVPILRDSVKVVLTLDISGSMNLNVQGGSTTRIQALKDAVDLFVPNLEAFQQEGDSIGLTYFSSSVFQPSAANFDDAFIGVASSSTAVNNDMGLINPANMQMTGMASGLLNAKNKLLLYKDKTPNTKRMVFLFTDGLQNFGPLVNADGNTLNNGVDRLNDGSSNSKDSIRYFTVATWGAGLAPEILSTIASASGGKAIHVVQTNPTLEEWFSIHLCDMLAEGSPQMVLRKSDKVITEPITYSFNLNENIPKLLIEYLGKLGDDVKIEIFKDGTNLTPKATYSHGNNYRIYAINLPIIGGSKITSGGKWEIKLTGPTQNPHNLLVMADDHHFDYNCSLNKTIFTVGDTIHFATKLSYADTTISGVGNSVKAILLKPGDDIGQLLSTYQTPAMDSAADGLAGAAYKYQQLMANDTSFYNALLAKEQNITLTDQGNGLYKGSYANTNLAGIYNVIFLINGELANVGKFERTTLVSSVFKFGHLEEETPVVVSSTPSNTSTSTGTTTQGDSKKKDVVLKIKPVNKYGKYLGPGFSSTIKVVINPSKKKEDNVLKKSIVLEGKDEPVFKEIKDNLDGSYSITIANVPTGTNPSISISVRDEKMYEGKIYPIPWWVYLLLIIVTLLIVLLRYFKTRSTSIYNILLWILALTILIIVILQYFGFFIMF